MYKSQRVKQLGLKRAGYYDQAGAIRDMVQNHMLQILMMTAMNLPEKVNACEIREEKAKGNGGAS